MGLEDRGNLPADGQTAGESGLGTVQMDEIGADPPDDPAQRSGLGQDAAGRRTHRRPSVHDHTRHIATCGEQLTAVVRTSEVDLPPSSRLVPEQIHQDVDQTPGFRHLGDVQDLHDRPV